ncbi:MAG TPA: histidine phosphatase family protein, partial [Acidimicrobiales bacterium]|nr:histidine phosphatase family protein [Acidimicrobiales bacterium]
MARPSHHFAGKRLLFLVRHGRTDLNASGVLRGHLDPGLDGIGRSEARRLGDALGTSGVRVVVSSPLSRAVQTAEAVASPLGITVRVDPRLVDRDYGRWAGRPLEDIEAEWGSVDDAPGVEPVTEVRARGLDALEELGRTECESCVAVSHDAVNRAILGALDPSLCDSDRVVQPTGCANVLAWSGGSWRVLAAGLLPR